MNGLERLERAKGGPFTFRVNGQVRGLPSPAELAPDEIVGVLMQGFPPMIGVSYWKMDLLAAAWSAHFDLPAARQAQRLIYLVTRYADEIEHDLRITAHEDLGDLWRARRWRYLLNLIDRLPSHSYYTEAVSNDEEHAELIAKAEAEQRERGGEKKWTPPLRTWTPEVDMLARVVDAVNGLKYVTVAINSEKGKTPPAPDPQPRPTTAIERARAAAKYRVRLTEHNALARRLVPHRFKDETSGNPEVPAPTENGNKPSPGTAFLRRKAGLTD